MNNFFPMKQSSQGASEAPFRRGGASKNTNAPAKSRRRRPTTIDCITIENTFQCKLVRANSPNQLYVKLTTDITRELQWECPHELKPFPADYDLQANQYVMAPLKEALYARAVVIDKSESFVLVEFIDEGTSEWVHRDTLVEMEYNLFYHPKQAVHISLFGFDLQKSSLEEKVFKNEDQKNKETTNEEGPFWTLEHTAILHRILKNYSDFQVRRVRSKVNNAEYVWPMPIKVELFGIDGDNLDAIAPRFAAEAKHLGVVYKRDAYFGVHVDHFYTSYHVHPILNAGSMVLWRTSISDIWGTRNNNGIAPNGYLATSRVFDDSFVPSPGRPTPIVKTHNMEIIRQSYADESGRVSMFIVPKKEVSPFEFYGIPLKKAFTASKDLSCTEALKRLMEERTKFTEALNAFYIEKQNQHEPNYVQLLTAVCHRQATYAIYETPPSESAFVARYRRVMLVDLLLVSKGNENDPNSWMVKAIFLDFGGSEIVPMTSLLQIHTKHCEQEPFTVQLLCPVGDFMPTETKMNYEQRLSAIFKAVVPTDFIVSAKFSETGERSSIGDFDPKLVHLRPNVLMAKHLREADRTEELDSIAAREYNRAQQDEEGRRKDNELQKHLKVKKVGFGKHKRLVFDWVTVAEEPESEVFDRDDEREIRRPQTAQPHGSDWANFFLRGLNKRR